MSTRIYTPPLPSFPRGGVPPSFRREGVEDATTGRGAFAYRAYMLMAGCHLKEAFVRQNQRNMRFASHASRSPSNRWDWPTHGWTHRHRRVEEIGVRNDPCNAVLEDEMKSATFSQERKNVLDLL